MRVRGSRSIDEEYLFDLSSGRMSRLMLSLSFETAAALSALIREHGRNQMHNNINTDQNNAGTNGNGINNNIN